MDALPLGLRFSHMEMSSDNDEIIAESHKHTAHRDDYYLFLFVDKAEALLTIDFEEIILAGKNAAFYVRPGQVHSVSSIKGTRGWFLMIDSMLVGKSYKNIFEEQFHIQQPVTLNVSASTRLDNVAQLLYNTTQANSTAFSNDIALNLSNTFIGIIAEQYAGQEQLLRHKSRSATIAQQFKKLLSENFKTQKSPAQYAEKLNYSLSHLNESVKNTTGFPVSYWIHQQIVLEAKRLLCHTDMDVKQIAFSLGYEDHAYFTRLFSKVSGMPPVAFRSKFHE